MWFNYEWNIEQLNSRMLYGTSCIWVLHCWWCHMASVVQLQQYMHLATTTDIYSITLGLHYTTHYACINVIAVHLQSACGSLSPLENRYEQRNRQ